MTSDLPTRLRTLDPHENPRSAHDLLQRGRRRRRIRRTLTASASALAVVLAVVAVGGAPGVRSRGVATDLAPIAIRAVVDRPSGPVRLADGDAIGLGDGVVVEVVTPGPGTLRVREVDGTPVWPPSGTWSVGPGDHTLGDDQPLAWVPERTGATALVVRWCPTGTDRCAESALHLVVR